MVLQERGYKEKETVFYYENRPLPFSKIWLNESEKIVLIIDHGLCEQPVCGATWSYQDYVKKQNKISQAYRWLRYEARDTKSLNDDLSMLETVKRFQRVERRINPRESHPQVIGRQAYRMQLKEWRKEMARGNWIKFVVSL